jgi:hypothetical protein
MKKLLIVGLLATSLISHAAAEKEPWQLRYDLANACDAHNLEEIKRLLDAGVDPNEQDTRC